VLEDLKLSPCSNQRIKTSAEQRLPASASQHQSVALGARVWVSSMGVTFFLGDRPCLHKDHDDSLDEASTVQQARSTPPVQYGIDHGAMLPGTIVPSGRTGHSQVHTQSISRYWNGWTAHRHESSSGPIFLQSVVSTEGALEQTRPWRHQITRVQDTRPFSRSHRLSSSKPHVVASVASQLQLLTHGTGSPSSRLPPWPSTTNAAPHHTLGDNL